MLVRGAVKNPLWESFFSTQDSQWLAHWNPPSPEPDFDQELLLILSHHHGHRPDGQPGCLLSLERTLRDTPSPRRPGDVQGRQASRQQQRPRFWPLPCSGLSCPSATCGYSGAGDLEEIETSWASADEKSSSAAVTKARNILISLTTSIWIIYECDFLYPDG